MSNVFPNVYYERVIFCRNGCKNQFIFKAIRLLANRRRPITCGHYIHKSKVHFYVGTVKSTWLTCQSHVNYLVCLWVFIFCHHKLLKFVSDQIPLTRYNTKRQYFITCWSLMDKHMQFITTYKNDGDLSGTFIGDESARNTYTGLLGFPHSSFAVTFSVTGHALCSWLCTCVLFNFNTITFSHV